MGTDARGGSAGIGIRGAELWRGTGLPVLTAQNLYNDGWRSRSGATHSGPSRRPTAIAARESHSRIGRAKTKIATLLRIRMGRKKFTQAFSRQILKISCYVVGRYGYN